MAVLRILSEIESGKLELAWSFINESENFENPFEENKWAILKWKDMSQIEIVESIELLSRAKRIMALGLRAGDALHLACAVEAKADFFLTTDDKILKKVVEFDSVIVTDPIRMVDKLDEYDN